MEGTLKLGKIKAPLPCIFKNVAFKLNIQCQGRLNRMGLQRGGIEH